MNMMKTSRVMEGSSGPVPPVLDARGVTKVYGDATVLRDVHLSIAPGEVHALLGENGAGKSTFIKIISGCVKATRGSFLVSGDELADPTPHSAAEAGVSTLHQELAIAPGLSVAENVFLGRGSGSSWGIVRWRRLNKMAELVFEDLGFPIDVTTDAGLASPIQQTMTALARALSQEAPLLVLDEPTASLTDSEVSELFAVVRRLQERGVGVLYVSHRLEEVFALADTYTILRDGEKVTGGLISDTNISGVITAMSGRRIDDVFPPRVEPKEAVRLSVEGLESRGVKNASFDLHEGEILGIAGLAGAGRSELVRTIAGAQRRHAGSMILDDERHAPKDAAAAQRHGVVLVPEERRAEGLLPDSIARNLNATTIDRHVVTPGIVSARRENGHAENLWATYDIRGSGTEQDALRLSGGNQQKVVLAKFLALDPQVIILDEPTRGVDVATKAEIYHLIAARAEAGASVIVVSSELPELLGLCNRIAVMHEGRLSAVFDASSVTEPELLSVCYGQAAA